ncbi:kinetochore and Eb1-associated basic protein isoform X2 [Drosophila kikkawai]|uniref:Kinetochore and Eb1-associated basic protein isoform X2 n=1 Tax=Drosophila kikkawai TaxID=30033 RepID=A0A6P4IHM9_DROKI|nr:kinetochore and Eb1-associated basic protein isoform X2 [Drosophila kikkawai]
MADGWSEPRPLRSKELLEVHRSHNKESGKRSESRQETGPLFQTPEMSCSIPSITVTQSEFRLERPKELLERMERSRSASKVPPKKKYLTPENRQRTWEKPKTPPTIPLNIGLPLRSKKLLEQQRSRHRNDSTVKSAYYQILSSPVRSQYRVELLNTPEIRPAVVTSHSEIRLERPRELLERLEKSQTRSASASKIPASCEQRAWEEPKTPEMSPCSVEPGWEVRPLRTKELLERERQASINRRTASASKIEKDRTKAAAPVSSLTASRLLVPSIGFSYPKDPKACLTSAAGETPLPKLTNTKRNLFHQKESLRQKLERITDEWQRMTESQLRQLILDFVNLCLPHAGAKCSYLSRDGYVNQLMEALQQLQYPREVNKTWLRMPKSQKAMSQVFEILRFFLDFAYDEKKEGLCVFPIVSDEKQIFEQAAWAFRLGEECPEQRLEESGTSSDIISLQQDLENLKLQPQDPDLCSELHSLQQEKQRIQEELANCRAEIELVTSESANKLHVLGNLYLKKLSQAQLLGKLKERVKNQSCSIQDYGKMVDQLEELRLELQLHRLRLQEFGERLRLRKLKLKRCQREQKESIEAFNVCIRDYEYSLTSVSSHPTSLQLSPNATIADVEEVITRLRKRRVLPTYIFAC